MSDKENAVEEAGLEDAGTTEAVNEEPAGAEGAELEHAELTALLEDARGKADEHWDQVLRLQRWMQQAGHDVNEIEEPQIAAQDRPQHDGERQRTPDEVAPLDAGRRVRCRRHRRCGAGHGGILGLFRHREQARLGGPALTLGGGERHR